MLDRRRRVHLVVAVLLVALAFWGKRQLALPLAAWQAPVTGLLGGALKPSQVDAETQMQLQRYRALEMENQRLKELLNFRPGPQVRVLGARVAGRDPNLWFSEFSIDRGRADGLDENWVVVTERGVVGPLVEVAAHSSRVRLLVDPQTAVPVMLSHSGATGLLYGRDGYTCVMKFVDREVEARQGEWVLTSGLGDIYPVGLPVGQVVRILGKSEALSQTLEVAPSVVLGSLHEVLVMRR